VDHRSRAPPARSWPAFYSRQRTLFVGAVLGAALATPVALAAFDPPFAAIATNLPVVVPDLGASFVRMLLAYMLSLGFALAYGYFAATNRTGERILIPILDILQSVPILGFFPVAIVFFVSLTPGSIIGANLASIFLIFTSMSWNMVFGVYESLKSVPTDLKEAADSFDVRGTQRLRQVLLPATVNRLVYNSVLSWTGGWYFLVAAEFISTASKTTALPGIGTYLLTAAGRGDSGALVLGLVLLIALVAALDLLVWRPLGRWAEKYRYDQTPSGEGEIIVGSKTRTRFVRAAGYVRRGFVTSMARMSTPFVALATRAAPRGRPRPWTRAVVRNLVLGGVLILAWLMLIALGVGVFKIATGPVASSVHDQIATIPAALGLSASRLVLAYALSLAIALPLAVLLARRPKASRIGLPVIEIIASTPATALFPVFVFGLAQWITPYFASVLMILTGMIWYLFFNMLSGVRGVPPDLDEAAKSYGLEGDRYRRRLLFPAIFPSFVTGSITAFGGGWNALVVAEFLQNPKGGSPFHVLGIGQLIDVGNAEAGGLPLMVAALFTMVLTVVVVNELLWKPLYRKATEKYRYD
jgi:NitT/TauT family transport system permease protein